MNPQNHRVPVSSRRLRIILLGAFFAAGLLILSGTAFFVQIRGGKEAREALLRQSVRRIRIPARRGRIITSDNVVLADNVAGFSLLFYPGEMRFNRRAKTVDYMLAAAEELSGAIGRKSPLTREEVSRHLNMRPGFPLTVFSRLNERETARLFEKIRFWRGVEIEPDVSRVYPRGRLACHLVGYTGKDLLSAPEDRREYFYYVPDIVGRNGVEKAADGQIPGSAFRGLRGKPGYSMVQVDHLGFVRRNLIKKIAPVDGNHVVLTIESRAQAIAEKLLEERRGAIVMVDAGNGDILAAASAPGYGLDRFVPKIPAEYYRGLRENPDRPLLHRAFQGSYTPGSIMKPLVALGFLEAGLSAADTIDCDGFNAVGDAVVRCAAYRYGGHGALDLVGAIKHSCNSFMIKEMLAVGKEPVTEILERAGIGRPTGVEIGENPGVFPSAENKKRRFGTGWTAYDSALLSIGQGVIETTPLQAALFTAAIANGGTLWKPHLVKAAVDPFGNVLFERAVEERGNLGCSPEALGIVREGMFEVVQASDGSGRKARVPGLEIYGKTGSAEVGKRPHLRINAWFVAFVSYKNRTYALAMLLEDARSGGNSCAPVVGEFFRRYFNLSD